MDHHRFAFLAEAIIDSSFVMAVKEFALLGETDVLSLVIFIGFAVKMLPA